MVKDITTYQKHAQWQDIIDIIDNGIKDKGNLESFFVDNVTLLPIYQRACLEIGRGANFHRLLTDVNLYNYQALLYYSFSGETDMVKFILEKAFSHYDVDKKKYWLAIASQAENKSETTKIFSQLASSKNLEIASAARYRLQQRNFANLPQLNINLRHLFEVRTSDIYDSVTIPIISLISLNALIYIGQVITDKSGEDIFLHYGALIVPSSVYDGEWWRFLTAGFIHFSQSHILFNLLALFIIGKMTRKIFSSYQVVIIYLGSLILSNIITVFAKFPYSSAWFAGASGAIMGLLGAVCYYHFKTYCQTKKIAHRKIWIICLCVISLQLFVDMVSIFEYQLYGTGSINSLLGHLSGFVCGFYISAFLLKFSIKKA